MTKLINHPQINSVQLGLVGENLFAQMLDQWRICYMRLEQSVSTKPLKIRELRAKRVDFVLPSNPTLGIQNNLLVDVKNYRLNHTYRRFIIRQEEVDMLSRCQEAYGTPEVHIAFHNNDSYEPSFYMASIQDIIQCAVTMEASDFLSISIDALSSVSTLKDFEQYILTGGQYWQ
ncbi:MAG: hypothetical protein ABNH02_12410 [Pseudomonadales bacterium]|jgi:hypothetical protein